MSPLRQHLEQCIENPFPWIRHSHRSHSWNTKALSPLQSARRPLMHPTPEIWSTQYHDYGDKVTLSWFFMRRYWMLRWSRILVAGRVARIKGWIYSLYNPQFGRHFDWLTELRFCSNNGFCSSIFLPRSCSCRDCCSQKTCRLQQRTRREQCSGKFLTSSSISCAHMALSVASGSTFLMTSKRTCKSILLKVFTHPKFTLFALVSMVESAVRNTMILGQPHNSHLLQHWTGEDAHESLRVGRLSNIGVIFIITMCS